MQNVIKSITTFKDKVQRVTQSAVLSTVTPVSFFLINQYTGTTQTQHMTVSWSDSQQQEVKPLLTHNVKYYGMKWLGMMGNNNTTTCDCYF